jgi:hypothetical protein
MHVYACGAAGAAGCLEGLMHFISWQHPHVHCTQQQQQQQQPAEDSVPCAASSDNTAAAAAAAAVTYADRRVQVRLQQVPVKKDVAVSLGHSAVPKVYAVWCLILSACVQTLCSCLQLRVVMRESSYMWVQSPSQMV